jgi:hypothetical protein
MVAQRGNPTPFWKEIASLRSQGQRGMHAVPSLMELQKNKAVFTAKSRQAGQHFAAVAVRV